MIKKKYIAPEIRLISLPEPICMGQGGSDESSLRGILRVYPNSSSTESVDVDNSEFL